MCGICGKLNFDRNEPVDLSLIGRMSDAIAHRGPDGDGHYFGRGVGLGHRRLSIIDLYTGDQPMSNEDGSVWVVYNGEIYNFAELRLQLEGCGHVFKSKTDTEVIVHAYEQWGEDAVKRLRGMFTFALWDVRNDVLLLARDRVGIKPLYYVNTSRGLLFASEIKCLLVDPSVPRRINERAIDRFLAFQYLPGVETLLEGIQKLPPGHILTVRAGQVTVRQYWDLHFATVPSPASFDEAVEELNGLLRRTVADHMISDVPVGVLLSGGVDSSGVLGYAVEQTRERMRTFTVGFADAGIADERPYARMAAERHRTEHHELTITAEDFRDFLPRYVWHMEEPVCEPPAVALYYVARLARTSGVKVLLSGEGGDEAFGGYRTYRNLLLLERSKATLGPAKGLLRLGLSALARAGLQGAAPYGALVSRPLFNYYLGRTATPPAGFVSATIRSGRAVPLPAADPRDETTSHLFEPVAGRSALSHMLYVDTKTWLPDDLLVKADKMTMATSTELRVPLLDFQILEFAAALPAEFKVRNGSGKRVLKAALETRVPRPIVERKKAGFPVPYESWLKTELREFVSDTLLAPDSALTSYFDRAALRRLVTEAQGSSRHAKEIFSLLVLELWHRQFLAGTPEVVDDRQPVCLSSA